MKLGSSEIRRTSDKLVESQLDKTGQAKSQASDSNGLFEKMRRNIGPAFTTLAMGVLALGTGGAEGSTPEAHSTALTLRGSDKAIGLPPAFPPEQRAEIIGKSPTEPYVPAPRPEWLAPYQGPPTQQLWPNLYDQMVKGSGEKGQTSKNSLQGEAQEIHDEETSSGQAKPDKHQPRKLLSLNEKKIATVQALQTFEKRPNDKKVRERSLLERNPKNARQLMQIPGYPFIYTQLNETYARTLLDGTRAFQEATQYLGKQPDWNNTYAYDTVIGGKGIMAIYPSEGYSTTFIAINNPSAGNDTFGLLGQFVVQSNESAFTVWSTPQGETFAASLMYANYTNIIRSSFEVLISDDIVSLGNVTFSPSCFIDEATSGLMNDECASCETNLFANQFSCSDCVLTNGPSGMLGVNLCLATENSVPCVSVSLSGAEPGVQLWPYMMKISDEVYGQNDCMWNINITDVTVGLSYACPSRTCPPGRAYYALNNLTESRSNPTGITLKPGERKLLSNFETWVYCSTLNETGEVNYISMPTSTDLNIVALGEQLEPGQQLPTIAYSANLNFHVYDASMYPDLHPYPALPSACGENDPNCTQLCARHPEANIPSDKIPAQYPESRPPEAPAHRHKGLSDIVIAGMVVGGVIVGGSALGAAAWCCYRKRENCIQSIQDMREAIYNSIRGFCGQRQQRVVGPDVEPSSSPDGPRSEEETEPIHISMLPWKYPTDVKNAGPSSSPDGSSSKEETEPIHISMLPWKYPTDVKNAGPSSSPDGSSSKEETEPIHISMLLQKYPTDVKNAGPSSSPDGSSSKEETEPIHISMLLQNDVKRGEK